MKFQENKVKFTNSSEIIKQAKNLMLCVKPQDITLVLETYTESITKDHLLISIVAGTRLDKIQAVKFFKEHVILKGRNANFFLRQIWQ